MLGLSNLWMVVPTIAERAQLPKERDEAAAFVWSVAPIVAEKVGVPMVEARDDAVAAEGLGDLAIGRG